MVKSSACFLFIFFVFWISKGKLFFYYLPFFFFLTHFYNFCSFICRVLFSSREFCYFVALLLFLLCCCFLLPFLDLFKMFAICDYSSVMALEATHLAPFLFSFNHFPCKPRALKKHFITIQCEPRREMDVICNTWPPPLVAASVKDLPVLGLIPLQNLLVRSWLFSLVIYVRSRCRMTIWQPMMS